jgi:hypothetical protein
MKTYLFNRDAAGRALITVKNGDTLYPLRHIIVHSPTGMDFGYGGAGCSDAAISILFDLTSIKTNAAVFYITVDPAIYRKFKSEFIATIDPDEGGSIPEDEIMDWLKVNAPELVEANNVHTA